MTPGQGRNTLQPIAAVGGAFDDGVRLHEVRIDGADKARTVRGEAFELLRCIKAVEGVPVLEVELHHGVDGQLVVGCGLAVHIAGHDEVLGIAGMAGARLDELGARVAPFALELGGGDVLGAADKGDAVDHVVAIAQILGNLAYDAAIEHDDVAQALGQKLLGVFEHSIAGFLVHGRHAVEHGGEVVEVHLGEAVDIDAAASEQRDSETSTISRISP